MTTPFTPPSKTANGWIDLLRHVLILAVIFQHMPAESRYSADLNAYIRSLTPAIDGAVAGFFMISGYFSVPKADISRLARKVIRLALPYLLFSATYGFALIALGKIDMATVITRTVTGAGVGPQLYFLPYLALITVAFNYAAWRDTKSTLIAIIAGLLFVYVLLETPNSTGPNPRLLALYALAFAFGLYLGRYSSRIERLGLGAISLIAVLAFFWQSRFFDLPLILALFVATIEISRHIPLDRRLPGSGGVYLLHTPILNFAISSVLWGMGLKGFGNVLLAMALTYVAALAVTLVAIRLAPRHRWLLLE